MKHSILIVDDEIDLITTIKDQLELLVPEDIIIDYAINGEEGLKKCSEHKFNLIITDYKMPKLNGAEMVKSIQKNNNSPNVATPILMITGFAADLRNENFSREEITLLEKPYDVYKFGEIISGLLTRRPTLVQI